MSVVIFSVLAISCCNMHMPTTHTMNTLFCILFVFLAMIGPQHSSTHGFHVLDHQLEPNQDQYVVDPHQHSRSLSLPTDPWFINRTALTAVFGNDSRPGEVQVVYDIYSGIQRNQIWVHLLDENCTYPAESATMTFANFTNPMPSSSSSSSSTTTTTSDVNVFSVFFDFNTSSLYQSNIWNGTSLSQGEIKICIRVDLVSYSLDPPVSVSFWKTKLTLFVNLMATFGDGTVGSGGVGVGSGGGTASAGVGTSPGIGASAGLALYNTKMLGVVDETTQQSLGFKYGVRACQCEATDTRLDAYSCLPSPTPIDQYSALQLCIQAHSSQVQVHQVTALRLQQGNEFGTFMSLDAIVDSQPSILTTITILPNVTSGAYAVVKTHLLSEFFQNKAQNTVDCWGEVVLQFKYTSSTARSENNRLLVVVPIRFLSSDVSADFNISIPLQLSKGNVMSTAQSVGTVLVLTLATCMMYF